jgi:hypothetical protein
MTQAPTYFKHIHGWDIKMVSNIIFICLPKVDYKSVLASFQYLWGVFFLAGCLKIKADFGMFLLPFHLDQVTALF